MADSGDGASSWPGLFAQLNKTFDLIRDVFGYALPGAVFLAIGVMAKKAGLGGFSLQDVKGAVPFQVPGWALFLGTLAACYATGDIMAAIAYMPMSVIKWIQWQSQKKFLYPLKSSTNAANPFVAAVPQNAQNQFWNYQYRAVSLRDIAIIRWISDSIEAYQRQLQELHDEPGPPAPVPPPPPVDSDALLKTFKRAVAYDRLRDNPTEATGDLAAISLRHPEFLFRLDRRETLALMSGSMCAALLSGWFVFYYAKLHTGTIFLLGGAVLLTQFSTAFSHLRRVRRAVREADAAVPKDSPLPPGVFE